MADLGSIAALKAANDARLPDNNTNAISEGDVRDSFTDTADTVDGLIPVSPIPPSWEMTLAAAVTPTTGQVTPNNDTASAVTTLKYYENDRGTVNRSADFALMRIGGIITNEQIAQGDGITQEDAVKFRITGAPTLASNVWTIPVAHVSGVFSGILSFWYVSYAGNAQVPVINTTAAPTAIHCVVTGTTDGTGRVTVDFTAASGNRPAFSAVHFVGGSGTMGGSQLTAYIQDETLSAYIVQFWNLQAAGEDSGDTAVSFVILGIPA